jgi:hypothetical protein
MRWCRLSDFSGTDISIFYIELVIPAAVEDYSRFAKGPPNLGSRWNNAS